LQTLFLSNINIKTDFPPNLIIICNVYYQLFLFFDRISEFGVYHIKMTFRSAEYGKNNMMISGFEFIGFSE
jgi:hypothetical protein